MKKNILILTLSQPEKDPRILRIASAIHARGNQVRIVCLNYFGLPEFEEYDTYSVERVPIPHTYLYDEKVERVLGNDLTDFIKRVWPKIVEGGRPGSCERILRRVFTRRLPSYGGLVGRTL